jgi:ribosomal protein S18
MPRKTRPDKPDKRGARGRSSYGETRTPRPKPKIDFTCDALDFKNITLLRTFVTDQGAADAAHEVKEEATLARGFFIPVWRLNRL